MPGRRADRAGRARSRPSASRPAPTSRTAASSGCPRRTRSTTPPTRSTWSRCAQFVDGLENLQTVGPQRPAPLQQPGSRDAHRASWRCATSSSASATTSGASTPRPSTTRRSPRRRSGPRWRSTSPASTASPSRARPVAAGGLALFVATHASRAQGWRGGRPDPRLARPVLPRLHCDAVGRRARPALRLRGRRAARLDVRGAAEHDDACSTSRSSAGAWSWACCAASSSSCRPGHGDADGRPARSWSACW